MNYDILESFHSKLISLVYDDVLSEETIKENAKMLLGLNRFKGKITDEQVELVIRRIQSEFDIRLDLGAYVEEKKHKKWFLKRKTETKMIYWERYEKYLLNDKKFPINVINSLDDVLDTLADLAGDPQMEGLFQRRGLIIGDVQSGKTSNYTGLICKAADVGFKVIVLLTGTIEKLRKQTQMRLDEGFIGMDSKNKLKRIDGARVGVGKIDRIKTPAVLTSTLSDFRATIARSSGLTLSALNEPILFVVKKNVSVLRELNNWLQLNANKDGKINTSLLLIDDEADNASINTNKEDKDPTSINKQIRKLLKQFNKASYVGFTATPFANIFIDPETSNKMLDDDLFPRDYIYALEAPTNYIGARDIFGYECEHESMLRIINDAEYFIPEIHKSDFIVQGIPNSLKKAIIEFLLANVIRDLRGDINTHRSMLVNVSRFTKVQHQIGTIINEIVKDIQKSIRIYSKTPFYDALKNNNIMEIYNVWKDEFSSLEFKWENVQNNLNKSCASIKVFVVNQKNKGGLNYDEYSNDGLRAIAVGGMSLSRGLTLEGLVTSYFYRNSKMYDTLMQMGRWFGYRPNYSDLCRIWMSERNIEWYQHISDASDELRGEIKIMSDDGLTPKDFGLRVRNDINALSITARNKMRTANSIKKNVSLSCEVIETPKLFNNRTKNKFNFDSTKTFLSNLIEKGYKVSQSHWGRNIISNVNYNEILGFLKNIEIPHSNYTFNISGITNFIKSYDGHELEKWDIVFTSGDGEICSLNNDINIKQVQRSYSIENDNKIIRISGKRNRLGGPTNTRDGLSEEAAKEVDRLFKKEKGKKSKNQKMYFTYINPSNRVCQERNPLLMIYLIELTSKEEDKKQLSKDICDEPLVGLGIGIPFLNSVKTKYATYQLNPIAMKEHIYEDYEDEEEE